MSDAGFGHLENRAVSRPFGKLHAFRDVLPMLQIAGFRRSVILGLRVMVEVDEELVANLHR